MRRMSYCVSCHKLLGYGVMEFLYSSLATGIGRVKKNRNIMACIVLKRNE